MMLYTKYESSGPCSFRQEIFGRFILKPIYRPRDLLMQPTGTVLPNLIEGHSGIIPVKFGQIFIGGSREDVV